MFSSSDQVSEYEETESEDESTGFLLSKVSDKGQISHTNARPVTLILIQISWNNRTNYF